MANKRMFSKDVVAGSQFIMLPSSARDLYFYLGLFADDDGYCEYVSVVRLIAADHNDLRILQENGFISVYNLYTLCIQDWYTHNKIPPSRYAESKYLKIFPDRDLPLNKQYNPILKACIQSVHNMSVEGSIGEGSREEIRKEIPIVDKTPKPDKKKELAEQIINHFNKVTGRSITLTGKTKSQIMSRIKEGHKLEDFNKVTDVCHNNWKEEPKMKQYLHPQTLFNSGMDKRIIWEKSGDGDEF